MGSRSDPVRRVQGREQCPVAGGGRYVGFLALFRGITEIVVAFELKGAQKDHSPQRPVCPLSATETRSCRDPCRTRTTRFTGGLGRQFPSCREERVLETDSPILVDNGTSYALFGLQLPPGCTFVGSVIDRFDSPAPVTASSNRGAELDYGPRGPNTATVPSSGPPNPGRTTARTKLGPGLEHCLHGPWSDSTLATYPWATPCDW